MQKLLLLTYLACSFSFSLPSHCIVSLFVDGESMKVVRLEEEKIGSSSYLKFSAKKKRQKILVSFLGASKDDLKNLKSMLKKNRKAGREIVITLGDKYTIFGNSIISGYGETNVYGCNSITVDGQLRTFSNLGK